jgi:FlaA1/EpsC-like NDP-sugar epimerase
MISDLRSFDAISQVATGRACDLFLPDVQANQDRLRAAIEARRVLVIGAAGSIGSATTKALAQFGPASLHTMDQNENGLVELVRDLRNSGLNLGDFRALPLDYGSSVTGRFLREVPPYDLILNFAALKHVRSEKDVYSLTQMLTTNVIKQFQLMEWLSRLDFHNRYFSVSTDKAANPVSLMGASKRLMEHVIFTDEMSAGRRAGVASARFANVAFSDGSLLDSFTRRIQKRQPIAVPRNTYRYFISLGEAAHICLLAAVCAPPKSILIPRLEASRDLHELETVATALLRHRGLVPERYELEDEARAAVQRDLARGRYPLLLSPLDTSGEKGVEEFVGRTEETFEIGMAELLAVKYRPDSDVSISGWIAQLRAALADDDNPPTKRSLVAMLTAILPQLRHHETGKWLDDRM